MIHEFKIHVAVSLRLIREVFLFSHTRSGFPVFYACEIILSRTPEASSIMRALSSVRCTDVRLYTLRIKIGTRTTSARELSHC